ncbi:MAG: glycosyltransferase family 4 protein [Oscillatoriales cyanobacterium C42_A2020_001]|nr:glycosyltransferase family 4 protein [Leptolyngbyaceae cyanobacterium C42_A2020_001]
MKALRILYAAGPGDVVGTYQQWANGQDDHSQVAVTYSGQFYEVCRELGAKGYILSSHPDKRRIQTSQFIVEHRPKLLPNTSAIAYQINQLVYGVQLIASAIKFKADFVVVDSGTTDWYLLPLLPVLGIRLIPSLHCVLWRKYQVPKLSERILLKLGRSTFANSATAILSMSSDIDSQIVQLTAGKHRPLVRCNPVYRRSQFKNMAEPDRRQSPFRVLFAGRIEDHKGVFDLLEVAKQFAAEGQHAIVFDVCGDGTALEALKAAVRQAGLGAAFVCHGHCDRSTMRTMFERSHVVIVPTRTDFTEGFNQVVAEGILAHRPVVTSSVCPALSYVQDAVVEVPPNDVQAYKDALTRLYEDHDFYQRKQEACWRLQEQFYDLSRSWGAALKTVLEKVQPKQQEALRVSTSIR